jgi:site-specific DNA-cytosine methylase
MKPNTRHQSAVIRASVEEAHQKTRAVKALGSPWRYFRPRGRQKAVISVRETWWIDLTPDAFYAEAKRRSDLREAQITTEDFTRVDAMGDPTDSRTASQDGR